MNDLKRLQSLLTAAPTVPAVQVSAPVGFVSQEFLDGKWHLDHIAKTAEGQISKVIPVFTHPQPAQQGSVPEGWRLTHIDDPKTDGYLIKGPGMSYCAWKDKEPWLYLFCEALATTPKPEGDGWVSSFERAPTKSDADFSGQVIWWEATDDTLQEFRPVVAHYDPNWWEGGYFEDFRKDIAPSHPFWKPTGLKRPQPPREGSGNARIDHRCELCGHKWSSNDLMDECVVCTKRPQPPQEDE